jgi:hypothetical protein
VTQSKNGVSALELMRQLGITYNAAWRMKHKLMQVMKERDDSRPLEGIIQLDDAYVISDGLPCFRAVQGLGCEHEVIVTGGGPSCVELDALTWINTMIGNVKNSIHGSYHAINEKHLPRYLAEFCYRFNRRFKLEDMIPRLGYVAMRTPPMP